VTSGPDDDLVPVSVRLGEVVPPEDPEDWTRPLTWVAALGMLAGPLVTLAWFAVAPPSGSGEAFAGVCAAAAAVSGGAAITGATQQGAGRALAATLGSALFAGLVVIIIGAVMAGERQVESASPTLAVALVASVCGFVGAIVASAIAVITANRALRLRLASTLVVGVAGAVLAAWIVYELTSVTVA
jgi:hypothetical protein